MEKNTFTLNGREIDIDDDIESCSINFSYYSDNKNIGYIADTVPLNKNQIKDILKGKKIGY